MQLHSRLLGFALLAAPLGCAVDPSVETAAVDPALLRNADENQASMAAEGMVLDGRVWLAPDSYVAFYSGGGRQVHQPIIRADEDGVARWQELAADPGEDFATYLARLGGGVGAVTGGTAHDVALFLTEDEPRAETAAAALSNQHCNLSAFELQCAHQLHMSGISRVNGGSARVSTLTSTWKVFDLTSGSLTPRRTSVRSVICADQGTIDTSIVLANFAFGGGSAVSNFTIPQGTFTILDANAGFRQVDRCITSWPFGCLDWVVDTQMNRFDSFTTITPRTSGSNFHWCGNTSELADYRFSDDQGARCSGRECPSPFQL